MRRRSTTIIFTIGAAVVVAGVLAAMAQNVPWDLNDPESKKLEQMLRDGNISPEMWEKLWENYQRKEAYRNLSDQEKKRIKEEAYRQYLREQAEMISKSATPLPAPQMGILGDGVDSPLPGSVFEQTTPAWRGTIDEALYTVTTGAFRTNPLQGVVLVMDGVFDALHYETYLTPTASGPVRIVREHDGMLMVQSIAGEYEVYDIKSDTRERVVTPGDAVYHFDVKTRTFR